MGRADRVAKKVYTEAIEVMRVQDSELAAGEVAAQLHICIEEAFAVLSDKFCAKPHKWHGKPRAPTLGEALGVGDILLPDSDTDPVVHDEGEIVNDGIGGEVIDTASDPLASLESEADRPVRKAGKKR